MFVVVDGIEEGRRDNNRLILVGVEEAVPEENVVNSMIQILEGRDIRLVLEGRLNMMMNRRHLVLKVFLNMKSMLKESVKVSHLIRHHLIPILVRLSLLTLGGEDLVDLVSLRLTEM